jgi:hypothetical protein
MLIPRQQTGVMRKTKATFKIKKVSVFNYVSRNEDTWERVEVQLHTFLTSALDGPEWSVSLPGRFHTGKDRPQSRSAHEGEERKKSCLFRESIPGRPARSLVTIVPEVKTRLFSATPRKHLLILLLHIKLCISMIYIDKSWDISVIQRSATELFSSPPRPDRLWGPPSLLSNPYQGIFLWG